MGIPVRAAVLLGSAGDRARDSHTDLRGLFPPDRGGPHLSPHDRLLLAHSSRRGAPPRLRLRLSRLRFG